MHERAAIQDVLTRGNGRSPLTREALRRDVGVRPEEAALRHLAARRNDEGDRLAGSDEGWVGSGLEHELLAVGEEGRVRYGKRPHRCNAA